jgi:hypothetical protein
MATRKEPMKRRRQFIIIGPRDKIYFRVVLPALLVVVIAGLAVTGFLFYKINFPDVEAEDRPSKYLVKEVGSIQAPDVRWSAKGSGPRRSFFAGLSRTGSHIWRPCSTTRLRRVPGLMRGYA